MYQSGETAGFEDHLADDLIKKRFAVDPVAQSKADAKEKSQAEAKVKADAEAKAKADAEAKAK